MTRRSFEPKTLAELEESGLVRSSFWAADDQLSHFRRQYDGGDQLAAISAFACCSYSRRPVPDWVTEALFHLLRDAIEARVWTDGKGPQKNPLARAISRQVDYERWGVVVGVIHAQGRKKRPKILERYRTDLSPQNEREALLRVYKKDEPNWGSNLADALEVASFLLAGHFGAGSPDQIRRSYRRVESSSSPTSGLNGIAAQLLGYGQSM